MQDLRQFFSSKHFIETKGNNPYEPDQLGAYIKPVLDEGFDWDDADIVILGCGEQDGQKSGANYSKAPDAVREQLYKMYAWHTDINIADAGNILQGASPADSRAALRTVLTELEQAGKTVLVIGGSHDLTMQQYEAFKKNEKIIHASVTDMLINMDETEELTADSFLMDMLTGQPNFIKHYNHIGFQSYYVHPKILGTLDKLRFDFFRLGTVREHMDEVEPALRNSHMYSFDMSAIRYAFAPANKEGSPNGFDGDEACQLMKYAGMSDKLTSMGIYGFDDSLDVDSMTAKQIAQMIWYFIDGRLAGRSEAKLSSEDDFLRFNVSFMESNTVFLKSKRTNRWWMNLPDGSYVPCSYKDYQLASMGEIPERWLREQERLV